jgi:hypothetical protein
MCFSVSLRRVLRRFEAQLAWLCSLPCVYCVLESFKPLFGYMMKGHFAQPEPFFALGQDTQQPSVYSVKA